VHSIPLTSNGSFPSALSSLGLPWSLCAAISL
jgi:hypothetical protein